MINKELPADTSWLAKIVLLASIAVAFSYLLVLDGDGSPTSTLAWKGAGVWLLAIYAALQARSTDGWILSAVMALCAAGDVLVETDLERGAMAFAAGHVIAMTLYARNRRASLSGSQLALALIIVPATAFIAWLLPTERDGIGLLVTYSLFLALMAALAWSSRFPRYRVGIGAMLFVVSDLLIFAAMGALSDASWPPYAIWLTYYVGQLLIVLGVTQTLSATPASRLQ